jgi:hypothetical protein
MRDTLAGREGMKTGRARSSPDREATRNVIFDRVQQISEKVLSRKRVADVAELEVNDVDIGHQGVLNMSDSFLVLNMLPSRNGPASLCAQYVTRVAIETHKTVRKQDRYCPVKLQLSLIMPLIPRTIVPLYSIEMLFAIVGAR